MTTATDLTNAISRYQSARPALRDAMHASALVMATRLAEERDTLVVRLEKRWRWCDMNEGHHQFIDREDAVLADLATYEQMQSALDDAFGVLFTEAA